nr:MAG TPA: hypothetical protein [Caudoviricetes sp.]
MLLGIIFNFLLLIFCISHSDTFKNTLNYF